MIKKIFVKKYFLKKMIAGLMAFIFAVGSVGSSYAQNITMPAPGTMVALSESFAPSLLKGIKVYADNPFLLDFILDKGNSSDSTDQLKVESIRLIKYFLASITVPEKDLWVNLSPYEKDRIVPNAFGVTEMGRDLLAQDYMLKQITASVIYPEGETGKAFWAKVYAKAQEYFGTTDIPVDTFNKVWIVPEKAVVFESVDSAYVVESRLKVMLETDYLAESQNMMLIRRGASRGAHSSRGARTTQPIAQQVLREIVIPLLEKEVNEGKNFAQLRQIYHALILATWFKDKIRESLFGKAYVDKEKTGGVDIVDKTAKEKIWTKYAEAFKKGAYNYIKEDYDPTIQDVVVRKYFSGGAGLNKIREAYILKNTDDLDASEVTLLSKNPSQLKIEVKLDSIQQAPFLQKYPALLVDVPKPVNIPHITVQEQEKWLKRAGNDRTRKIRQFLLDNIVRVSFLDFQKALFEVVDQFNQIMGQDPYVVLWNEETGSSRRWVYEMVKDRLMIKPVEGLYYDGANHSIRMKKKLHELVDQGVNTFVIFDDASYSGHQILQTLKSMNSILLGRDIKVIIVVPYYTTASQSILEMFKTEKEEQGANIEIVTISSQRMPSINDLLSMEDFEYLYKNRASLSAEDLEDLSISPAISIWTLTYFDFKVPDELSFMKSMRNLLPATIIPPYKIKKTPYSDAEEKSFDEQQMIEGKKRLQAFAKTHPEDANYLKIFSDQLVYGHTRKKTHVINVIENAYRFINFSDEDVEYFFSRLKEVQENENKWSPQERMDRFNAYKKALKKARDMYSEIPQEYQRMLMPLAIFHDVGSLSVEGDSHWRGKGIPELDYYLEARDWLHHAIGAGIVLRLDGILPQDVDLLATLIFHHGAIANVGVDFFKSDILNKFDQHLQKLFLIFLLMDMSGRQDGNNAVNEKFIDAFIKKVESLSKQTDAIFVAERISKGFGMLAIDIETRFKWLMAVKSYFQLSGRYNDFIRNWKRVRVNQFEFFIRIAKKSPQIYAQMLAQISDALGDYLRDDDDVFIETDIDFLGLPFGQGKDQQRNQWIEIVYERINAGRPLLFKIKENPVLDFHLSDKNNPLKFSIKERKAYVFEIQLKQMKEEENKRKVYPSVDSDEDRASVVTEELQITGGVDLTQQEVSIQRKNSLQSLSFNFNSTIRQQLENLIGLSPVIINIHPMTVTVLEFMKSGR